MKKMEGVLHSRIFNTHTRNQVQDVNVYPLGWSRKGGVLPFFLVRSHDLISICDCFSSYRCQSPSHETEAAQTRAQSCSMALITVERALLRFRSADLPSSCVKFTPKSSDCKNHPDLTWCVLCEFMSLMLQNAAFQSVQDKRDHPSPHGVFLKFFARHSLAGVCFSNFNLSLQKATLGRRGMSRGGSLYIWGDSTKRARNLN